MPKKNSNRSDENIKSKRDNQHSIPKWIGPLIDISILGSLIVLVAFSIQSTVAANLLYLISRSNKPSIDESSNTDSFIFNILITIFIVLIISRYIYARYFRRVSTRVPLDEIHAEEQKLADELKDPTFAQLWQVTQLRIDRYHNIATEQADKSFKYVQISMWSGFLIIIIAIFIAIRAQTTLGAITTGAVGLIGSALSAYISTTFMKSHAQAAAQLGEFFSQPVELTRLLAAERLIEEMPEDRKSEAKKIIVSAVMNTTKRDKPKA